MRDMQAEKIYTDILEQLDNAAAKHTFPVFNNFNFPLAAMRIVAFRDDEEWLILFERIAYGTSEGTFLNMISAFGNFIGRPGLQATIRFIEEVPRFPIWNNEQDYILNEKEFEAMVYGKAVKFSFDENDYRATYPEKYPGMNRGLRLLRLICHALGPKIYMTPSDLLERIDHNNIPEL